MEIFLAVLLLICYIGATVIIASLAILIVIFLCWIIKDLIED